MYATLKTGWVCPLTADNAADLLAIHLLGFLGSRQIFMDPLSLTTASKLCKSVNIIAYLGMLSFRIASNNMCDTQ
jgi:hypothetical protein